MRQIFQYVLAIALSSALLLAPGVAAAAEQSAPPSGGESAPQLSQAQLEQLAAPVALYPDSLLAQVLMASTYPLEVVDAARWLKANSVLKGTALDTALQKESWDPSVKSLVKVPQTLTMMNEKLDWTESLGNAFLAQPQDVMNAVQHLRAKAEAQGNLKSNTQQTVKTESSSGSNVIVIESPQPDVIYVPAYNPTVVYGPWPYPSYPPYSWYPPGYVAGTVVSFGVGVAVGYALWGYPDWHHGDVDIDVNYYTRFSGHPPPPPPPYGGGGHQPPPPPDGGGVHPQGMRPGGDVWSHNPDHRGNVPYTNHNVAERFQRTNQGGLSPSQERVRAREAFRGHSSMLGGGSGAAGTGAAGLPARMEGRGLRPGQEGGAMHHSLGGTGERRGELHTFQGRPGGGASVFSGARRPEAFNEIHRGTQSRQIMHMHPDGGGFHRFRR